MIPAALFIFTRVTESKQQSQLDRYGPAHKLLSLQLLPYVTLHSLQKHGAASAGLSAQAQKHCPAPEEVLQRCLEPSSAPA